MNIFPFRWPKAPKRITGDSEMLRLELDMFQTLALAVLALMAGEYLGKRVSFLARFCVPSPVVGGMIFALMNFVLYMTKTAEIVFDETLRNVCMVFFFTSVGFQANIKMIKAGGKALAVLLFALIILIFLQNAAAAGLSSLLGLDPMLGLCTGSIPMVGGHGTAGAFGPILEDFGIRGATTICTAAATFGLIAGSVLGGPLANSLIIRKNLLDTISTEDFETAAEIETHERKPENYASAVFQLVLAAGAGTIISRLLSKTGMTFPVYIGSMIVAAISRNVSEYTGRPDLHMGEIQDLGGICLNLFLGIAMITLKLWQLAGLALPFFILLAAQTVLMFLFARFIVFRLMGSDYDAAVISGGVCGFGMGATPNAMANMQAVCEKYAPSVKAFLLIPVIGSLFADFINTIIITFFINLF